MQGTFLITLESLTLDFLDTWAKIQHQSSRENLNIFNKKSRGFFLLFANLVRSTRKIRVTIAKNEIVKKFWNWNLPSLNFWMKCKRRVNQSLEDFIDFHYVFISSRPDNPPKGKSIKMISWGKLFDAHCSKLPLFVQNST